MLYERTYRTGLGVFLAGIALCYLVVPKIDSGRIDPKYAPVALFFVLLPLGLSAALLLLACRMRVRQQGAVEVSTRSAARRR